MSELTQQIRDILEEAGMTDVPEDASEDLRLHGMDSLMMVITVSRLESELQVKVTPAVFAESHFHSISSIAGFVRMLRERSS